MDEIDCKEISDFLQSRTAQVRTWPKNKNSKNSKRNFRQKCSNFALANGTLHYNHKKHGPVRVIKGDEKDTILQACHDSPGDGGHFGINKTTDKIVERYYWPGMYEDIETYIGKLNALNI